MFSKWQKLIRHVWTAIVYWELVQQYRKDQPADTFFALTWHAVRNELFMEIARIVALCEQIGTQIPIGPDGEKALAELKELYAKGDLFDRSSLDLGDCGVKVFRDKAIAHPANPIKEILGKDPYKISVKWDTVEETIDKVKRFCEFVERHNLKDWQTTHYLGKTGDGSNALKRVLFYMDLAEKYDKLKRDVVMSGKPRIWYDWANESFVVEND